MNNISVSIAFLLFVACNANKQGIYSQTYETLIGTEQDLISIGNNPFNIFVAFDNNCPLCKASIPTLQLISQQFDSVGIVLFYPANPRDSQINQFIRKLLPQKVISIKDKNKQLTIHFGAKLTPEVFVVNRAGNVVYRGAVDNRMMQNWKKNLANPTPILLNALDTLVHQKKPLINHENKAMGCFIE